MYKNIHLHTNPSFTPVLKGMGLVGMKASKEGEVLNGEEGLILPDTCPVNPKPKKEKHTKYLTTFRIVQHF